MTVVVAIAAAMALATGVAQGSLGFLGIPVDLPLLSVGLAGVALAIVTLRASSISSFLRVFSTIFAVEYVLTSLAYLVARVDWWPTALTDAAPPASLPITLAIFSLLVYLLSFVRVIGQITGLADPYFATGDRRDVGIVGFGRRQVTERHFAAALTVLLVVINQFQVAINVRLSFFNRDWFNAIQNKDGAAFWSLLFGVFCVWAAIGVVSHLIEFYAESVLKIGWRRWMTERYYGLWLDQGNLYRTVLVGRAADNPDQRIAEDVRNFLNSTYAYSISMLSTVSSLVSFSIILWTIPADFTIPGTDITVPGLPFWIALGFSVAGTWLTHLIGQPLVRLDIRQERFEADFRFALARVREYSEQVALLHGEPAERTILGGRFGAIVANFYDIVSRTLKLLTFTTAYSQLNVVIPYIIVAPYFFLGKITLGQMTQTGSAFGRVKSALSFFITRYQSLASYKAAVERLSTFRSTFNDVRALGTKPPRIEHHSHSGPDLRLRDLNLYLPDGREIVRVRRTDFRGRHDDVGLRSVRFGQVHAISRDRWHLALWQRRDRQARPRPGDAVAAAAVCAVGQSEDGGDLPLGGRCLWRRGCAGGSGIGAARAARRRNRRRGPLGLASFRGRAAASGDCPGVARSAGLAVPRRGDIGTRRGHASGDLPHAEPRAARHDDRVDRPSRDADRPASPPHQDGAALRRHLRADRTNASLVLKGGRRPDRCQGRSGPQLGKFKAE